MAIAFASTASAQVLNTDSFSFVGALTANGWAAHSGAGNKVINSDGNVVTLEFSGGSGEDVNLPFAARANDATTYASFTLNVPSGNPVNPDGNGSYFAHFKDVSFGFRARTGLVSPAAGGDYGLGINASSSSIGSGAVWATDLLFDTNYTVVISYDAATGESKLWVDPANAGSTSISHTGSTGTIVEQFAWRQSNDHTGFITVDDLVVGGTFDDVTVADPANSFIRAATEVGCGGIPLHFTSAVSPADPTQPATWAGGSNAVVAVTNMDPAINLGVLVFGNGPTSLPVFGGLVVASPDVLSVVIGNAGAGELSITIPGGLTGASFYTQFVSFDGCVTPGNFAFSNGQAHVLP